MLDDAAIAGSSSARKAIKRLRRVAGVLLAPLLFGLAVSQIEAIFHGIDVRHGMAWKPAWSEGIAVFPIASYVGAIGPSLVVMLVLRVTRWTSDARKIIGIFALTCVLALLATYVEAAIVRDPSATLSNVIFVTGLVCLPGISIPALYCLIAGVPWRRPQAG
jgi:hypothetical protein